MVIAAGRDDALAERLAHALVDEVSLARVEALALEQRAGDLRQAVRQDDRGLGGRAGDGRLVVRREIGRMLAVGGPAIGFLGHGASLTTSLPTRKRGRWRRLPPHGSRGEEGHRAARLVAVFEARDGVAAAVALDLEAHLVARAQALEPLGMRN